MPDHLGQHGPFASALRGACIGRFSSTLSSSKEASLRLNFLGFAGLFIFALSSHVAMADDARLPVPGRGTVVLPVPDGWKYGDRPGRAPTIAFSPVSGEQFIVLVSSFGPGTGPDSLAAVRTLVEASAANVRSQAVEQTLPIKDIRSAGVQGHYFSATDKAPKPGEFKNLTQGAILVQGQPSVFTILSNGDPNPIVGPALRMLGAAKLE
jgi:hypothetical protein